MGKNQRIRLSREFLASVNMKSDEVLTAEVKNNKIVLSKSFQHRSLQERAAAYGGELHLSKEIFWDDPCGNEVW